MSKIKIAYKDIDTKTKTCQMHGEPYEIYHPHTLILYKIDGKKVKQKELNYMVSGDEQALIELFAHSKNASLCVPEFVDWDELVKERKG